MRDALAALVAALTLVAVPVAADAASAKGCSFDKLAGSYVVAGQGVSAPIIAMTGALTLDSEGNGLFGTLTMSVVVPPRTTVAASGVPAGVVLTNPADCIGTLTIEDFPFPGVQMTFAAVFKTQGGKVAGGSLLYTGGLSPHVFADDSSNLLLTFERKK